MRRENRCEPDLENFLAEAPTSLWQHVDIMISYGICSITLIVLKLMVM